MVDSQTSKSNNQNYSVEDFIDQLIEAKDKDASATEEQKKRAKELLLQELNNMINAHLVSKLSPADQIRLDELLDKNAPDDEINTFFLDHIPQMHVEVAAVMIQFRSLYLTDVSKQNQPTPPKPPSRQYAPKQKANGQEQHVTSQAMPASENIHSNSHNDLNSRSKLEEIRERIKEQQRKEAGQKQPKPLAPPSPQVAPKNHVQKAYQALPKENQNSSHEKHMLPPQKTHAALPEPPDFGAFSSITQANRSGKSDSTPSVVMTPHGPKSVN